MAVSTGESDPHSGGRGTRIMASTRASRRRRDTRPFGDMLDSSPF